MQCVSVFVSFICVICLLIKNTGAISDAEKSMIQSKLVGAGIECVKDYPLSLSDIKTLKNKMLPNNKDAKCFAACMFKKVGIMDDMGKISPDTTRENAKKVFKGNEPDLKNVDEIMGKCAEVNQKETSDGSKGCDRAKLAFECLVEQAPKYGFDIEF